MPKQGKRDAVQPGATTRAKRPQGDSNSRRRLEKPDTADVTNCDGETREHDKLARSSSDGSSELSDADLWRVVEAWPTLPEHVRSAILTLVRGGDERGAGKQRRAARGASKPGGSR